MTTLSVIMPLLRASSVETDRADLALEEPGAEHRPALRRAVEGDDRIVLLARDVDRPGGLPVEERGDRHAERARDLAERVQRRREPPRLDLRHHARRHVRLLGELALLELALHAERLDALAERRHGPDGPWPSNDCVASSDTRSLAGMPAMRRSARATNTRVIFLRYGCVKSVLSSGLDGPAATSRGRVDHLGREPLADRAPPTPSIASRGCRGDRAEHDARLAHGVAVEPHAHRHAEHREVERAAPSQLQIRGASAVRRRQHRAR